jgi:hypothetical protein
MAMRSLTWLALLAPIVAAPAHATLLTDGGFESGALGAGEINGNSYGAMPGAGGARSWDVWDEIGNWKTTRGAGIEVQTRRTVGGADPQAGDYYVELDSHPRGGSNSTMAQDVALGVGSYRLSYWYQPRTKRAGDNSLAVFWDGVEIASHDETTLTQAGWVQHIADVDVTTAGDHTLAFAARGTANSFGAFVDSVELTPVPLPGALPLLGAGLAGLAYLRRRAAA